MFSVLMASVAAQVLSQALAVRDEASGGHSAQADTLNLRNPALNECQGCGAPKHTYHPVCEYCWRL